MGGYEFTALESSGHDEDEAGGELDELIVSAHHDVSEAVARGLVVGESVNLARDLQNRPANDLTPTRWPSARAQVAEPPRHAHARGDGPRRDRGGRAWAPSPASPAAATRSRS